MPSIVSRSVYIFIQDDFISRKEANIIKHELIMLLWNASICILSKYMTKHDTCYLFNNEANLHEDHGALLITISK